MTQVNIRGGPRYRAVRQAHCAGCGRLHGGFDEAHATVLMAKRCVMAIEMPFLASQARSGQRAFRFSQAAASASLEPAGLHEPSIQTSSNSRGQ